MDGWRSTIVVATGVAMLGLGCGDGLRPLPSTVDAAAVDAVVVDAATVDAVAVDAVVIDGAPIDADLDAPPPIDADLDAPPPIDAASCTTTLDSSPLVAGAHIPQCTAVSYATNPPQSGPHYPSWANFKTYATRVPRGFWVHSMEHGAVVVTYNCPTGCAAELAALQTMLDARPADPLCVAPLRNRFIVTPDPQLTTRFAASAWGFSLRSTCFDLTALGAFIDAHYAQAPENFCTAGFDPTDPASGVPADCP